MNDATSRTPHALPTLHAHGQSGRIYELELRRVGTELPAVAGVYAFTKLSATREGQWEVVDFGQVDDLRGHFGGLYAASRLVTSGVTHIAIYTTNMDDDYLRRMVANDLLAMYSELILKDIIWCRWLRRSADMWRTAFVS